MPPSINRAHNPTPTRIELGDHLKLDVVEEERFSSGALAQILVPKR
jgi:hypothetical protein